MVLGVDSEYKGLKRGKDREVEVLKGYWDGVAGTIGDKQEEYSVTKYMEKVCRKKYMNAAKIAENEIR